MCADRHAFYGARGASLIEVILFMVLVGIAAAAVLGVFAGTMKRSADPLIEKQALAIAESLMDEIRAMPFTFCDPDDAQASTATAAIIGPTGCATTVETMGPEAGENRYSALTPFDNVNDYNGFAMAGAVRDITNTVVPNLGGYRVNVAVAPLAFNGIPNTDALQITVTVTGPGANPGEFTVRLDSVRTRHAPRI
jgi:MSHA pilin protein MshD